MSVDIKFSQTYFWLNSWVMANIIQLGTQNFCERFVSLKIDPGRRLYDQMVMAARSGVANIAEGSARFSTSYETEMKLLDVARASFEELTGDYFNFLLRNRSEVWKIGNPEREAIWKIDIDRPHYSNSMLHDAANHILFQKGKFDYWIENDNPELVANAMLILCLKENKMLQSQMKSILEQFKENGGFSENMTQERMASRVVQAKQENAPLCPICGKPMLKRWQKRGIAQETQFWGCSDYPRCSGTRSMESGQ